eukprot:gene40210-54376_t
MADPLAGLLAAALVAHFAWTLLRRAGSALLDINPSPELTAEVRRRLSDQGETVVDLHLWRLGPGHHAVIAVIASAHPKPADDYRARLAGLAGLSHVTIEVHAGDHGHGDHAGHSHGQEILTDRTSGHPEADEGAQTCADRGDQRPADPFGGAHAQAMIEIVDCEEDDRRACGDARVVDEPARLPQAKFKVALAAAKSGYVTEVDAMGVALAALRLGAGRAKAEDAVDHAVGIGALVKIGERVEAGATLAVIYANEETALAEAQGMLAKAIMVGATPPVAARLIDEIVG